MSSNESFVNILLGILALGSPWLVAWLLRVFFGVLKNLTFVCLVVGCLGAFALWRFPEQVARGLDLILAP